MTDEAAARAQVAGHPARTAAAGEGPPGLTSTPDSLTDAYECLRDAWSDLILDENCDKAARG
ncbi:hypothetical protein GCM10017567_74260 [Amycolatopsis bullii]|uniref:Uncharacterized protein n=1 Tax=Amycolatopsis bullii TaxID=941987 RepID=A0ABQ3KPC0_9PSEU|nr:hypothetical protein GCM10017567_74260 [Amycolatopsis bullii]